MDGQMYELVRRILWAVGFMAVGGTLALMFLFVFAQSIFGLKTIHAQLERLLQETRKISEQLKKMSAAQGKQDDEEKS